MTIWNLPLKVSKTMSPKIQTSNFHIFQAIWVYFQKLALFSFLSPHNGCE